MTNTHPTKYIAVLRRAIPIDGYCTDFSTLEIKEGDTVDSVMEWADRMAFGSAVILSLQITKPSQLC